MVKEFNCAELASYLDVQGGKSLEAVAEAFNVSKRTAQRRIAQLRSMLPGVEIRESIVGGVKTFQCNRKSITSRSGMKPRDLLGIHELRLAARTLRGCGMTDHARGLDALAEGLMSQMPRAVRNSCERDLQKIAGLEGITTGTAKPVAKAGISDRLRLSFLAEREVTLSVFGGSELVGKVVRISYGLDGQATVVLRNSRGDNLDIGLRSIERIRGVEDLTYEALKAA